MIRHLLRVTDFSAAEIRHVFQVAARCKANRRVVNTQLKQQIIALVFQKPSVRTRVSFEVAARHLGGSAIYLGPEDVQLATREPIKDVARTLSRYVEAIVIRTFGHQDAEEFARYASVPVINGLSDLHHPCQALTDLFTVYERFGTLKGVTIGYVGDGNNVLHSLAEGAALLGVNLTVAAPKGYVPHRGIWAEAMARAKSHRVRLTLTHDPKAAARGADVLYTDVWTSMGQERERELRLKAFRGFQINRQLLALAKPRCVVMHCLPAHRGEEIADDVIESRRSIVFDQAENRLHVQKAILLQLLGGRHR